MKNIKKAANALVLLLLVAMTSGCGGSNAKKLEGQWNVETILTGSQLDGRTYSDGEDHTCDNWSSNDEGSAQVGHHDRTSPGSISWNSAHPSRGCSQENLQSSGGDGLFYCFAAD